ELAAVVEQGGDDRDAGQEDALQATADGGPGREPGDDVAPAEQGQDGDEAEQAEGDRLHPPDRRHDQPALREHRGAAGHAVPGAPVVLDAEQNEERREDGRGDEPEHAVDGRLETQGGVAREGRPAGGRGWPGGTHRGARLTRGPAAEQAPRHVVTGGAAAVGLVVLVASLHVRDAAAALRVLAQIRYSRAACSTAREWRPSRGSTGSSRPPETRTGAVRSTAVRPTAPRSRRTVMLVVQKYGGTSVADVERIRSVAGRIARTR